MVGRVLGNLRLLFVGVDRSHVDCVGHRRSLG